MVTEFLLAAACLARGAGGPAADRAGALECDLTAVNPPTMCAVYALAAAPSHASVTAVGAAVKHRMADPEAGASVDADGRSIVVWLPCLPVDWKAVDAAVAGAAPGAVRREVRVHVCMAEDVATSPPRQLQQTIGKVAGKGSQVRFSVGTIDVAWAGAAAPEGAALTQIRAFSLRPFATCRRRHPQPYRH